MQEREKKRYQIDLILSSPSLLRFLPPSLFPQIQVAAPFLLLLPGLFLSFGFLGGSRVLWWGGLTVRVRVVVSGKRFGVVKGGGAGFGLVGVGGCLIMVVSAVSWLGSFWGEVLGFKFWTVADFYGDFRLRGLVRGAAAVVSWLVEDWVIMVLFFFWEGRSLCVCLLQGYCHRRLAPVVVDCCARWRGCTVMVWWGV